MEVMERDGGDKLYMGSVKLGPKAGKSELFAELPGYPDNMTSDGVALHREKTQKSYGSENHLLAVRVGRNGKIVQQVRGPKNVRPTEVIERDGGKLYMGSVELGRVAVVKATPTPKN
uniref:Strictosidine synthase conserved region domain-containing protein n=1 Tax=Leersia perrieri TaxID=77586 RepID=A0A0D9WZZ3_9ORYZ